MEKRNLSPEAYRMHELLLAMAVGEEHAMKAYILTLYLGVDRRVIRKLREEINSQVSDIQRKVLTSSKGYYVAKQDDAVEQYRAVAYRKIQAGVKMIQEAKRLLEHSGMDGQGILKFTERMKEIVEIGK